MKIHNEDNIPAENKIERKGTNSTEAKEIFTQLSAKSMNIIKSFPCASGIIVLIYE